MVVVGCCTTDSRNGKSYLKDREELIGLTISTFAISIVSALSTGIADSLMPDGEFRSILLRTSAVISVTAPILFSSARKITSNISFRVIITVGLPVLLLYSCWPIFRAGIGYVTLYSICYMILFVTMLVRRKYLASSLVLLCSWDTLFMLGVNLVPDVPPMYLLQPVLVTSFSLIYADMGAISVIALAAKAYHRFSRDLR
jgi:hypothetical protein